MPLRRKLFLLAAAAIAPLAVVSGIGFSVLAHQQRVQAERVGLELARALATGVDAELRSSLSVLAALATTAALDRDDLPGFRERAQRVLDTQPHWAAVFLAHPSGTRLVDTRFREGDVLPPIADTKSFESLVRTRAPTVGNLAKSPEDTLLFPVRVPVLRRGELRYVLTAVEAALDAVRPAAVAKDLRLQIVLDPRAGPITGDTARLQQVMWNLLMNAVKFTPTGGRIEVHLQRIEAHVEIVVSDTGQGIAPGVLPFVFDRFVQADSSSTRAHMGLGLGLALVKHLVELHGGSVVAQSPGEGKGATFIVTLPLTIAEIPSGPLPRLPATAATFESPAGVARLDGLRVLVVDDEPDALELASAILTAAGATVRTCRTVPEALDVATQWRPDVLLSDIEMPGEDGYSLIRKIRSLDAQHGGRTPAVALTAHGRTEDRMRALDAGYSMHVPKPVDPRELTMIIAGLT